MKRNTDLLVALVAVISLLGLYFLSGTSDRLDGLSARQQGEVVARWSVSVSAAE